jgi:hypothetical protein
MSRFLRRAGRLLLRVLLSPLPVAVVLVALLPLVTQLLLLQERHQRRVEEQLRSLDAQLQAIAESQHLQASYALRAGVRMGLFPVPPELAGSATGSVPRQE